MSYFKPSSMTWWAGVLAILTGAASMAFPSDYALSQFGQLLALFAGAGDSSPAVLIYLGLGLIGARAKLERMYQGMPE